MLPGGLELRACREADLDQVAALLTERGDPADAEDARLVAADPDEGLAAMAVVVDGDRVVSTATLLRETVHVDEVALPAGQVELVATDRAYEGRGLVRALMAWAHETSRARGDLIQMMIGIPWFYTRFGYAYAVPIPRLRPLDDVPAAPPGVTVRPAGPDDLATLAGLQDAAQRAADVRMPHSPACLRWLIARTGSRYLVAERGGVAIASARMLAPPEDVVLAELAGEEEGLVALLAQAAAVAGEDGASIVERPEHLPYQAISPHLGELSGRDAQQEQYYARIPDLPALLGALAPVLCRRLRDAGLDDRRHDVLISSWGSHVRFSIDGASMSPVQAGGPFQAPISAGGSGIAPDALPALILGPDGARGLEERRPDCWLGRQYPLMDALFPPLTADLVTFYLPV